MTIDVAALLVLGVVVLGLLVLLWALHRVDRLEQRHVRHEQQALVRDLLERLLHAKSEGATIPPSTLEPEPQGETLIELAPGIVEWCEQWEDPTAREKWRIIARQYVASGLDPVAVIKKLEDRIGLT